MKSCLCVLGPGVGRVSQLLEIARTENFDLRYEAWLKQQCAIQRPEKYWEITEESEGRIYVDTAILDCMRYENTSLID
jgi:hypothetical protein